MLRTPTSKEFKGSRLFANSGRARGRRECQSHRASKALGASNWGTEMPLPVPSPFPTHGGGPASPGPQKLPPFSKQQSPTSRQPPTIHCSSDRPASQHVRPALLETPLRPRQHHLVPLSRRQVVPEIRLHLALLAFWVRPGNSQRCEHTHLPDTALSLRRNPLGLLRLSSAEPPRAHTLLEPGPGAKDLQPPSLRYLSSC